MPGNQLSLVISRSISRLGERVRKTSLASSLRRQNGEPRLATHYYRQITHVGERNQLVAERKVHSLNPTTAYETWYTPTRYDDPAAAQSELALPGTHTPIYRVGPIPENQIVSLTVGPRRVAPGFGHPGGGIEIATRSPVWLFSLWSFVNRAHDDSL